MYFMGVLLIVLGGWLVDSGVEGRHPVVTLEQLIQGGPGNVQNVLLSNKGTIGQAQAANLNPFHTPKIVKQIGKANSYTALTPANKNNVGANDPVFGWLHGIL